MIFDGPDRKLNRARCQPNALIGVRDIALNDSTNAETYITIIELSNSSSDIVLEMGY